MGNVLVIGNGFDLAHGLKTRYKNFVDSCKDIRDGKLEDDELKKIVLNNCFIKYFMKSQAVSEGWIDFENEIKRIINLLDRILKDSEKGIEEWGEKVQNGFISAYDDLVLQEFNSFFYYCSTGNIIKNHHVPCYIIQPPYYFINAVLNKKKFLDDLRQELDDLILALGIYLKKYAGEYENIKLIDQIKEISPSYVINFNYTDTCLKYKIEKEDIFYIHGSLDSDPCNMVLGMSDTEESEEKELDFIYFKKYFQRIQKLTGQIDESRFLNPDGLGNDISLSRYNDVHFYGHSLSKNDGDIIKCLKDIAERFIIYYLDQKIDANDYASKVINLIDIFGKKEALEMIQSGFVKFVKIEN